MKDTPYDKLLVLYKMVFNWRWTDDSFEENKSEFIAYVKCEVEDIQNMKQLDDDDAELLDLMLDDLEIYFDCVANDELKTDDGVHEITLSEIVDHYLSKIFHYCVLHV